MARHREFDFDEALTAALGVFWRKGYSAASTQELCEATGLGRGSLYNTFTDKRHLYLSALERYYELGTARPLAILAGDGTIHERVRALMVAVIDADLDDPVRKGCFAINAAIDQAGTDPDVRALAQRHFERIEAALREAFERARAAGEVPADRDPAVTARTVLSAYYGLRVLARATDDRQMLLDVVRGTLSGI